MAKKESSFKMIRLLVAKELRDYFSSWYVYVIAALFLIIVNMVFAQQFFLYKEATIKYLFQSGTSISDISSILDLIRIPFLLVLLIPALTMRSWAEEKNQGTIELLMTLPVSMFQLIVSKLVATMILVGFLLVLTVNAPAMTLFFGKADYGSIIMTYIGIWLMSSTLILLGQLISLYSSNQVSAVVVTLFCAMALFLAGVSQLTNGLPTILRDVVQFISFPAHLDSFRKGIIDTRDWLYFVSLDIVFVILILKSYLAVKIEGK